MNNCMDLCGKHNSAPGKNAERNYSEREMLFRPITGAGQHAVISDIRMRAGTLASGRSEKRTLRTGARDVR